MIELPPSIQVDRDEDAEAELMERARTFIETGGGDRAGIHASDLLMPRKGYWRKIDPQPLSDREVGLFLVGKVLHAFVLSELDPGHVDIRNTDEGSRYSETLGLWYSPDRLRGNIPVEFKTNRGMYPAKSIGDLETYLNQVLIYMAANDSLEGKIVVMYTNAKDESGKTSPQFRVFAVTITPDELVAIKLAVRKVRDELADAVQTRRFDNLPLCPAWLCHPEQCVWWTKCKPVGRYENFEYVRSKRK